MTRDGILAVTSWSILLASILCGLVSSARAQGVELRPVDRATVRIINIQRTYAAEQPRFDFEVSHGSGVVIADGWVATAGHVVDDAALLIVVPPGGEEGMPATVVTRLADRDLALLRVSGQLDAPLPIPRRTPTLTLGDRVSASGYPLDVREAMPAAVSGEIGRPLNDGRVQLSMSVNPGNSGGPVITEGGELVGIVSQGANPQAGAQGLAIMEQIGNLSDALGAARASSVGAPEEHDVAADMLLERLASQERLTLEQRVARLQGPSPQGPIASAIFANEADSVAAALLAQAGVQNVEAADPVTRGLVNGVRESADLWAAAVPTPASRLGGPTPPPALAQATAAAASHITGPATGPSPHAPPLTIEEEIPSLFTIDLRAWAGFAFQDLPNRDALAGGDGGVEVTGHFWLAQYSGYRLSFQFGLGVSVGAFRDRLLVTVVGVGGARMEFGPPALFGFAEFSYSPGFSLAEDRDHGSALGYRAALGAGFGDFEVGFGWRELGRNADDPLRSLSLFFGGEIAL
ncbi:MAG: S1C family serine protease [Sandaracinaceae bacterium]